VKGVVRYDTFGELALDGEWVVAGLEITTVADGATPRPPARISGSGCRSPAAGGRKDPTG
jgi:hypothetical protein